MLIKSTSDAMNNTHRISGLEPDTEYHVAVLSIEKNSVWGYTEKTFTTLQSIDNEEDVEVGTIPDDSKNVE